MITANIGLTIQLHTMMQPRDVAEQYRINHAQNIFNRIAYNYFKSDIHIESLRKFVATELLLEDTVLPPDFRFEV